MTHPVVIPILSRVELNGSYLSGTASRTITLPTVNVAPFYYATLILRVHEATWSDGALFKIEGFGSYPAREDAREFVATTTTFSAQLSTSDTPPAVATSTDSNIPLAYKFVATLKQGATANAALFVVASADLMLRPA